MNGMGFGMHCSSEGESGAMHVRWLRSAESAESGQVRVRLGRGPMRDVIARASRHAGITID